MELGTLISRWWYYLTSIPTLLLGIANWPALAAWLIRPASARGHGRVALRGGLRFEARSLMDVWVIKETCLDRGYEAASLPIEDGWTIVDIGAGLGDFTVDAARKSPGGVVYAYEPFPGSFSLLKENLALNGIANARPYNLAISGQSGTLTLYASPSAAVMHRAAAYGGQEAAAETVQVPAIPLDQVFADLGIDCCDFMKIDTEGAEYEILMNAGPATLSKIRHICLEYHDGVTNYSHSDLARFLEEQGFEVTLHQNPAHGYLGLLHAANRQPAPVR